MNKTRFEALSDGVFAFAITLLVLGFAVPMHGELKWPTDVELTRELLKLWPNLIAYALSFAVIGMPRGVDDDFDSGNTSTAR